MMKELKLTKRKKLLGAVIICLALITSSTMLWQMGQIAEAAILEPYYDGLVGWWRFDEGSGTIAKDSSGYGNHGTIYGATWVDGKYGKALSFDGVNDRVEVPNSASLQISDAITIVAWVKKDFDTDYMGIVEKPNSFFLIGKQLAPYGFYFRLTDIDGDKTYAFMSSYVPVVQWACIAATWTKGDYLRIHLNGVLDGLSTGVLGKSLQVNTNEISIGYSMAGHSYFNGSIDEVRVYNRTLSAAEIQETFRKSPDFSSKLLAKVPKGTRQVMVTVSWQGIGSIDMTIKSPSENYTEDVVPVYHKTDFSTTDGASSMLNIKRLYVTVTALSSDEYWYILLELNDVEDYRITVEIKK